MKFYVKSIKQKLFSFKKFAILHNLNFISFLDNKLFKYLLSTKKFLFTSLNLINIMNKELRLYIY